MHTYMCVCVCEYPCTHIYRAHINICRSIVLGKLGPLLRLRLGQSQHASQSRRAHRSRRHPQARRGQCLRGPEHQQRGVGEQPWPRCARPWARCARPFLKCARPWARFARPWARCQIILRQSVTGDECYSKAMNVRRVDNASPFNLPFHSPLSLPPSPIPLPPVGDGLK